MSRDKFDITSYMMGKNAGGGGGGTTNYNDLENKPEINGVTLNGDKSLEDLGIPTDLSDLSDIGIENPTDGQIMKYNETTHKWENYDGPSGCIKLGKVEAFFSESAPAGYLICDGTVYNKSDYPLLAAHLLSLTTHSQYEVDGDNTKFKVPDLRGEFLRGTGTNSHTNGGNGANVGVHQDGTFIPETIAAYNQIYYCRTSTDANVEARATNIDRQIGSNSPQQYKYTGPTVQNSDAGVARYATRPTNTSVLFCIAYCDIYVEDRHTYSTDEHIVGTWIDGRPVYEKVVNIPNLSDWDKTHDYYYSFDLSSLNIDNVIDSVCEVKIYYASAQRTDSIILPQMVLGNDGNWNMPYCILATVASSQITICLGSAQPSRYAGFRAIIQYTKTTDTPSNS